MKKENIKISVGAGPVCARPWASKARQNKGITLIALVITIIVMLILVSVTITMAVNGGLFEKAAEAGNKTNEAVEAEQTLANGEIKIGVTWYNSMDDYLKGIESVRSLQEKYADSFEYYSSLKTAVDDVNNNEIGENADAKKETAVAGVYENDGKKYVVLLKDSIEEERVKPEVDMTINLGGHTLSSKDVVCINVLGGNLTIDGSLKGSTVEVNNTDGRSARTMQILSGNVSINGGAYITNSTSVSNYGSINILVAGGNLTMENAKILATETINRVSGIEVQKGRNKP